jgi:Subtilase family
MPENKHHYLRNEQNQNEGFKKTRGFKQPDQPEDEEELPKTIAAFQKEKLRNDNLLFYSQRKRRERKALDIPGNIDFIRIYFYAVFNLDLQKKFFAQYGLTVVEYNHFNKTVLFELTIEEQFQTFVRHVEMAYESPDNVSYEGQPYNLIALINHFEFLSTRKRLGSFTEQGSLLVLVSSANRNAAIQNQILLTYLVQQNLSFIYDESFPEIIEIKTAPKETLVTIARNFDIVRLITSAKSVRLRPGIYGELRRDFGFDVNVAENLPVVGIIDTGVSPIEPLRNVFTGINYDHTGNGVHWDESGHGTMVAGLVVFGEDFISAVKTHYEAKAKIAIIKAIHNDNDEINIPRLLHDIRDAKRTHGIRLFNMSLNIPVTKKYNDSFSTLAYELDRLAYEEDVLITMSVGNYDDVELERLLGNDYHPSHDYPSFFYDPDSTSSHHNCWFSNIQEPSESLNNLSVGALAGNIEGNMNHDATPASEYPAYYTRKFHYDYTQRINGTLLKRNQTNKHLNKPDIVFEGGDLFNYQSGMEVLRSPLSADEAFYGRSCGTSIATPLTTSYEAEILKAYPNLRTQTVKALVLNTSSSPCGDEPPDFEGFQINLLKKLIGNGRPLKNNLITTNDNAAVFIIEDDIHLEDIKVIPLNLPSYIGDAANKLRFSITLAYSFLPVKDNHLNYLPLHISFGLFKPVSADVISNNDAKDYRIKSSISWSEDFFGVENRLFSNTQKVLFNLQPQDVKALAGKVSLAVRCTGKKEIPATDRQHLENTTHPFSIVISITEIPEAKAWGILYSELININIVEAIGEAEGSAEIDLEI